MSAGNQVPTIGTQELLTTVTVPNRSTVILGGLIQQSEEEVRTGLPFLSRIPVIKYLFSSTASKTRRRELIIMIQPTIVEGEDDLKQTNREENRRHEITGDAVRFSNPPLPVRGHEHRPRTRIDSPRIPRRASPPPPEKEEKKLWLWKRKASQAEPLRREPHPHLPNMHSPMLPRANSRGPCLVLTVALLLVSCAHRREPLPSRHPQRR